MFFKKIFIWFAIALFFSGGMLEKEMSKWDGYYRHYQYHVNRNPNYTITHFIYIHFLDGDHNQWLENRHKSAPFKTRPQQVATVLYFNNPVFLKEISDKNISAHEFALISKTLLPGFLSRIIKPPCC